MNLYMFLLTQREQMVVKKENTDVIDAAIWNMMSASVPVAQNCAANVMIAFVPGGLDGVREVIQQYGSHHNRVNMANSQPQPISIIGLIARSIGRAITIYIHARCGVIKLKPIGSGEVAELDFHCDHPTIDKCCDYDFVVRRANWSITTHVETNRDRIASTRDIYENFATLLEYM